MQIFAIVICAAAAVVIADPFPRHHPPPGLAFDEPKDRLRRMIQ
jgi:hypothetical protein